MGAHTHPHTHPYIWFNTTNRIKRLTPVSKCSGISVHECVSCSSLILYISSIFSSSYLYYCCYSILGGQACAMGWALISLNETGSWHFFFFFSLRLQKKSWRKSFLHTAFIGHGADLHSRVSDCPNH